MYDPEPTLDQYDTDFEKSFELIQDEEIRQVVVEYLKNIYFRLRTKSPEYEASYEKYNKLLQGE